MYLVGAVFFIKGCIDIGGGGGLKNDHKREKIDKTHQNSLYKLGFWANLIVRGWNYGLSLIWSYFEEFLPSAGVQNGPHKEKN